LEWSEAPFVLIMDSDIEIVSPDFVRVMYDYIASHDDVGIITPNREGESPNPRGQVVNWWYDGIAPIFRNTHQIRADQDYFFSQWWDVDLGEEAKRCGYRVVRDRRVSVNHGFADWKGKSAFYHAYAAVNRILLAFKWSKVGREAWHSKQAYNCQAPQCERIPTMYELSTYSTERLKLLAESVDGELPWFMDGGDRNVNWRRPW